MSLAYEQQFHAIQALYPLSGKVGLYMRHPGNWYATSGVEIKEGATLRSATGNGNTPMAAVSDLWSQLTDLKDNEYVVINAYHGNRRAVRWNGFMWSDVYEEEREISKH